MRPDVAALLCALAALPALAAPPILDELLSARCQAKCLSDFEAAATSKGIRRRTLKHTIIPLCKGDPQCSACAAPCQEPFESVSKCKRGACKESGSKGDCVQSCQFLNHIFSRKAGSCPKPTLRDGERAKECVAECRRDGDCGVGEKCCSLGCGRSCRRLELSQDSVGTWLPVPKSVTVEERRRGRSAVLRWVLPALRPHHLDTTANLFLIQWRWGVHEDEEAMNAWQTVAVRNKLYAILKHLLSPGRFYRFRVAAVNLNGTLGFSQPSRPFRLSRSPKAPGAPRNLNSAAAVVGADGLFAAEISWLPPTSDLPILHYQVTWAPDMQARPPKTSALIQADMPHKSPSLPDEDSASSFSFHKSRLLPGASQRLSIGDLRPGTRYIVEVQAIVAAAGDEELPGDKATLVLEPVFPDASPQPPALVHEDDYEEAATPEATLAQLRVDKPYYEDGALKAELSWDFTGPPGAEFAVSWWPTLCDGVAYPRFSLSKPLALLTRGRASLLGELRFGCSYSASVAAIAGGGELPTTLARASSRFETPACQDAAVKGDHQLDCPTPPPAVPGRPTRLSCTTKRLGPGLIGGQCEWELEEGGADVPSFRVLIGRRLQGQPEPTIDPDSVLIKIVKLRKVVLESLVAGTEYVVEVSALNRAGPSASAAAVFTTPRRRSEARAGLVYDTEAAVVVELGEAPPSHSVQEASGAPPRTLPALLLCAALLAALR